MLISIINLLLSPFCLLIFLFSADNNTSLYFKKTGETNVSKLKPIPYLVYSALFAGIILSIVYLWCYFSHTTLTVWEVFVPKNYWVTSVAWGITLITLYTYLKGMEGNIMGFIFFPLLLFSCMGLVVVNFRGLFAINWTFDLPAISIGFWYRLVLHLFLPIYLLLVTTTDHNREEKGKNRRSVIVVASILFQAVIFGVNWFIVWVLGDSLDSSKFYGEGQNLVYYLPMLFGFLYLILFDSKIIRSKKTLLHLVRLMAVLFCMIQLINYVHLMKGYFSNLF